jgi:GNAT superfamily N-acetyltransferase
MMPDTILIRDGLDNMDFAQVVAMLAKSHWSPGIGREEVEQGARHSALVAGAFLAGGEQVGYARVISDKTRFAYITDVYVDEKRRKSGVGRRMLLHILGHGELRPVYQWLLMTLNAHDFYARLGFAPTTRAGDILEIRHERPPVLSC